MSRSAGVFERSVLGIGVTGLVVALLAAVPLGAITVPEEEEIPASLRKALEKTDPEKYRIAPVPVRYAEGEEVAVKAWRSLTASFPGDWRLEVDARTGAPLLIEGQGIPLLPGRGNTLKAPSFGPAAERLEGPALTRVAAAVGAFQDEYAQLLGVRPQELALDEERSVGVGRNNRLWSVRYQQVVRDPALGLIPVRDAYTFFRIHHGNLTQFGNQFVTPVTGIDTADVISRQAAVDRARALLDYPDRATVTDAVIDLGQTDRSLQIVPVNAPLGSLQHELVRSLVVDTPGLTYELWFDARSGELVNAINRRRYADAVVSGGIFPLTNTDTEVVRGMPLLNVTNSGNKTTDLAGIYDYAPSGSMSTGVLDGDFVTVNDTCGASSLSTSADPGDLEFGTGWGSDCATPTFGGPGNTHAARSTFYHVNLIQEKARQYLPAVAWLNADLTANVNLNQTCNAFWNGFSINFYQSGVSPFSGVFCSNTGEIAAVFLHEWAHGLQDSTVGIPDAGTGEAFADVESFLETHDSCIGNNFIPGVPCQYGCDASCTGVRDVAVLPSISPATIEDPPADCDRWSCPYFGYAGVMGYQGHCESHIASGAFWDMAQALAGRYGYGAGWALADRLWYESVLLTGDAYQIVAGGQCNPAATIDGCGADNWYTVFLQLDDENGNLADGTPNADIIWNAFNNHGIACGAVAPAASTSCAALATPTVTVTPAADEIELSWTPVPGAAGYRVFRNQFGCDWGFRPIADVAAPTVTFTDSVVNDFTEFYYSVQAYGANDLCVSAFSTCTAAMAGAAAGPAAAPSGLEIGPYIGYFFFDSAVPISDGPLLGGRISLDVGGPWSVETEIGATVTDDALGNDGTVLQVSENFLFHLVPRPAPVEPFLTAGIGVLIFDGFTVDDSSFAVNIGGGAKWDIAPDTDLRLDLRDYIADDPYGAGTTHNLQLTLGVVFKVP